VTILEGVSELEIQASRRLVAELAEVVVETVQVEGGGAVRPEGCRC
jgi:hypothetical protein